MIIIIQLLSVFEIVTKITGKNKISKEQTLLDVINRSGLILPTAISFSNEVT